MSFSCFKCSQLVRDAKMLKCGHYICPECMLSNNFSEQIIIVCSLCSIMTLLHTNQISTDCNPQNYVVCLDCRSQVMSTRIFLSSVHRVHNVVSVDKVINDVSKNIRKYQTSFDLQNQALYSQVQSLMKQKRKITQQYSKNCLQMGNFYELLRNKLNQCQQESNSIYERMILDIVGEVDIKIREIKLKIQKCESYIECINHSLMKQNSNKYLFASQFYFKNYGSMDRLMDQLIETRRQILRKDLSSIKIISPNFNPMKQIINKIGNINNLIWSKEQQRKSILSTSNPQSEFERYFEQKRRQIFNKKQQESNLKENKSENIQMNNQQKFRKLNRILSNNSTSKQPYSYNIDARIQNLRKTLQLNQNNKGVKSALLIKETKK